MNQSGSPPLSKRNVGPRRKLRASGKTGPCLGRLRHGAFFAPRPWASRSMAGCGGARARLRSVPGCALGGRKLCMNEETKERKKERRLGYIPLLAFWVSRRQVLIGNRFTYGQNGKSERFDTMQSSVTCSIPRRCFCDHMEWEVPGRLRATWRPRLLLVVTLESCVNDGRMVRICPNMTTGPRDRGFRRQLLTQVPAAAAHDVLPMTRFGPGPGVDPTGLTSTRYGGMSKKRDRAGKDKIARGNPLQCVRPRPVRMNRPKD